MLISEQDDVFVSGEEGNIPEALANALRWHFGDSLSIACAWVRKRFVFLRAWADNAPENKHLYVATYTTVKLKTGHQVTFSFRSEDAATPESACCPPEFYEMVPPSNPGWRKACAEYADGLKAVSRLKNGSLIHVRRPLNGFTGTVHLLDYLGSGEYLSIPMQDDLPRRYRLTKEELAAHAPQVVKPDSIPEAQDTIRSRSAIQCGEYLVSASAARDGCHALIGRVPAGGFSPAPVVERSRSRSGAILFM